MPFKAAFFACHTSAFTAAVGATRRTPSTTMMVTGHCSDDLAAQRNMCNWVSSRATQWHDCKG